MKVVAQSAAFTTVLDRAPGSPCAERLFEDAHLATRLDLHLARDAKLLEQLAPLYKDAKQVPTLSLFNREFFDSRSGDLGAFLELRRQEVRTAAQPRLQELLERKRELQGRVQALEEERVREEAKYTEQEMEDAGAEATMVATDRSLAQARELVRQADEAYMLRSQQISAVIKDDVLDFFKTLSTEVVHPGLLSGQAGDVRLSAMERVAADYCGLQPSSWAPASHTGADQDPQAAFQIELNNLQWQQQRELSAFDESAQINMNELYGSACGISGLVGPAAEARAAQLKSQQSYQRSELQQRHQQSLYNLQQRGRQPQAPQQMPATPEGAVDRLIFGPELASAPHTMAFSLRDFACLTCPARPAVGGLSKEQLLGMARIFATDVSTKDCLSPTQFQDRIRPALLDGTLSVTELAALMSPDTGVPVLKHVWDCDENHHLFLTLICCGSLKRRMMDMVEAAILSMLPTKNEDDWGAVRYVDDNLWIMYCFCLGDNDGAGEAGNVFACGTGRDKKLMLQPKFTFLRRVEEQLRRAGRSIVTHDLIGKAIAEHSRLVAHFTPCEMTTFDMLPSRPLTRQDMLLLENFRRHVGNVEATRAYGEQGEQDEQGEHGEDGGGGEKGALTFDVSVYSRSASALREDKRVSFAERSSNCSIRDVDGHEKMSHVFDKAKDRGQLLQTRRTRLAGVTLAYYTIYLVIVPLVFSISINEVFLSPDVASLSAKQAFEAIGFDADKFQLYSTLCIIVTLIFNWPTAPGTWRRNYMVVADIENSLARFGAYGMRYLLVESGWDKDTRNWTNTMLLVFSLLAFASEAADSINLKPLSVLAYTLHMNTRAIVEDRYFNSCRIARDLLYLAYEPSSGSLQKPQGGSWWVPRWLSGKRVLLSYGEETLQDLVQRYDFIVLLDKRIYVRGDGDGCVFLTTTPSGFYERERFEGQIQCFLSSEPLRNDFVFGSEPANRVRESPATPDASAATVMVKATTSPSTKAGRTATVAIAPPQTVPEALSQVLDQNALQSLVAVRTGNGVTLRQCCGDDGGVYAGDAESYVMFATFFQHLIQKRTGMWPNYATSQYPLSEGSIPGPLDREGQFIHSTTVRLARNLDRFAFPSFLSSADRVQVNQLVRAALDDILGAGVEFEPLPAAEGARSAVLGGASGDSERGVYSHPDTPGIAVVVNDLDHVCVRATTDRGDDLRELFPASALLASKLGKQLGFAFRQPFGFLTADPLQVGDGVVVSATVKSRADALKQGGITIEKKSDTMCELTSRGGGGPALSVLQNFQRALQSAIAST